MPAPCTAQAAEDLTRALAGDGHRTITQPPALATLAWRDLSVDPAGGPSPLKVPFSMCWHGSSLVVADRQLAQLVVFAANGDVTRTIGSRGAGPGQFIVPTVVRCSTGAAAYMVADLGAHRVTFLDSLGAVLRTTNTPDVPQIDIIGEFALRPDGGWYDSWLGSDVTFGPYLSDQQWRGVGLVRRYGPDDRLRSEFGTPVPYRDRVARRVLNRVFLCLSRDTMWTLTQGDATIRGFAHDSAMVASPIRLPVYFRGMEPDVKVNERARVPGSDFLPNSLTYEPNVQGLAVVADSLFVTIRYRDWGMKLVHGSGFSMRRLANSSIEIVNRRGQVIRAYDAPGMLLSIETDGKSRIAAITMMRDNTQHVLTARLPF
ncbi:MAG TPA: hypothetical protein VHB25_17640 [Gemmatimonadaceae bacterium]|nr:hypothetical protein [Gemmatimonadaceae bacterium]